jgi:hypothetical protein
MEQARPDEEMLVRFPFLKDGSLSDDLKKFLVEKTIQTKDAAWSRQFELRKWRWTTPLAIALTGAITVAINFMFDHFRAQEAQHLQESTSASEATRKAQAEEREFEFKIVEQQLNQPKSEAERASVLLFLVRAGVFKTLNGDELKSMAEASLKTLKSEGKAVNVPSIPSLGVVAPAGVGLGKIRNEDDILDQIVGWEGGFTEIPDQPQTASNAGITLPELSGFLGRDASLDELKSLDRNTIRAIYKRAYFDPFAGISNFQLRAAMVNIAVISGGHEAIRDFQRALAEVTGKEVFVDGLLGPVTTDLINNFPDPNLLIEYANCELIARLKEKPAFGQFSKGWLTRIRSFSPVQLHGVCPDLT